MSFTLGFFVIFLSLIIPGLIFRRFYFFGEFSKQFNTKDPVLHSIYFSIIPGILIQVFSLITLSFVFNYEISFLKAFNVLHDFTQDVENLNEDTKSFLNCDVGSFLLYSIVLVVISGFLGYVLSRFVRTFQWDKKFKLIRFKNQWYYIFSGEILLMKKFKDAIRVTFNKIDDHDNEILTTYADILITIKEDVRELYTGFVVDYDLNSEDITKLDRIYLIDTYRYKRINSNNEYKKNELGFINHDAKKQFLKDDLPTRGQKNIPGDVFILNASNIVNINLTFVPNILKIEENKIKQETKHNKKQKTFKRISDFLVSILFIALVFNFTNPFSIIESEYYNFYLEHFSFFRKLLFIFLIIQFLDVFSPIKNDTGIYEYKRKSFLIKIFVFFIMIVFNIYNIIDFYFLTN